MFKTKAVTPLWFGKTCLITSGHTARVENKTCKKKAATPLRFWCLKKTCSKQKRSHRSGLVSEKNMWKEQTTIQEKYFFGTKECTKTKSGHTAMCFFPIKTRAEIKSGHTAIHATKKTVNNPKKKRELTHFAVLQSHNHLAAGFFSTFRTAAGFFILALLEAALSWLPPPCRLRLTGSPCRSGGTSCAGKKPSAIHLPQRVQHISC